MSSFKTVNLGLTPLNLRYEKKKISWPINIWKCILPKDACGDLDILQKLLLSSLRINGIDRNFLVENFGFSKDLLDLVKEKCIEEGYLNKEGQLTEEGLFKISNESFYNLNFESYSKYEKLYILQDAVSGDIIPNFSIKDIPDEEEKDDILNIPKNIKSNKKPTLLDIKVGLRQLKQLERFEKDQQKAYGHNKVDVSEFQFDDEVDWNDINENGEIEVNFKNSRLENNQKNYDAKNSKANDITSIKICDDTAKVIYADSYIYVNPDKPNEWRIKSPLGKNEDFWFSNKLRCEIKKNLKLKYEVDFFLEYVKESFKDKYPFYNKHKIELFEKFPKIANYPEFSDLKNRIESVKSVENRIKENGDEDYDTLFSRCQIALECLLNLCISKIKNRFELSKYIIKEDFKHQINHISKEIGIQVPDNYLSYQIAKSLTYVPKLQGGSIKDRGLFLLYDAYYNKESKSIFVLKTMPEFYENINIVANNRNKTAHFNSDNKENIDFEAKANKVLHCFNELVTVLFAYYFKGE